MKRVVYFGCFVFLMGIISCVGIKSTANKNTKPSFKDTIVWNENLHEFNTVPSGPPAKTKFTFVNHFSEPIKISNLEAGCSCTVTEFSKNEIKPGEAGWVDAAFKTENTFGYFRKHVDVYFSNGKHTHLILTGNVNPVN